LTRPKPFRLSRAGDTAAESGGTAGAYTFWDPAIADPVNYQYLDYLVDNLGLTGTRTWEVGPALTEPATTTVIAISLTGICFEGDTLHPWDAAYLVYFQNRILAKGHSPSFYSSPGYPTGASGLKPWVMNHPGERAQQIWANALYYKTNYGLNILCGDL